MSSLATNIKELRKKIGFTQKEMAEYLDISVSTIAMIENGKRKPSMDLLAIISKRFSISADELIHGPTTLKYLHVTQDKYEFEEEIANPESEVFKRINPLDRSTRRPKIPASPIQEAAIRVAYDDTAINNGNLTHTFIKQLINEGSITDENNISQGTMELIINTIKADIFLLLQIKQRHQLLIEKEGDK